MLITKIEKYIMNTYTITHAQLDELLETIDFHSTCLDWLSALKPNLQKPVGIVSTTPHNGTLASWYPDCEVKHNDLLYTHPAPVSKEDMTKVLDALGINRVMSKDSNGNYTKEVTPKIILEAIDIVKNML